MRRKKISHFSGIILVMILGLVGVFLVFIVHVYTDVQKVENRMFNLYEEFKSSNDMLEKFTLVNESSAKKSVEFTEATKNWQIYQNQDFKFQMKSPSSWGSLLINSNQKEGESASVLGHRILATFDHLNDKKNLSVSVVSYDFVEPGQYYLSANKNVFENVNVNVEGERNSELFNSLKSLAVGEIRNCYVYENILNQKYIIYRYVRNTGDSEINELIAVYPRDEHYLSIGLSDRATSEINYFLQGIVFLD